VKISKRHSNKQDFGTNLFRSRYSRGRRGTSLAHVSSLGTLMLTLIREEQETIETATLRYWSAKAVDFVEATSWASLDELSDVTA
jgi:hypothetical protein